MTWGEKQTEVFVRLICSASVTGEMHRQLISLSAFNMFLAITAFLGNTLILVALRKETSLHPPSKLLFRCLATTDLCVGLIAEPLRIVYLLSLVCKEWSLCRYTLVSAATSGYALASVSLLTMTAISVDRLLALLLGLRYRQAVTLKRTCVTVVFFWVMSIAPAASLVKNVLITFWFVCITTSLCVITSIVSYTKIFLTLRHHQAQIQDHVQQQQPSQTIPLNIARYRKAVSSALYVQLALVLCYLPYAVLTALLNSAIVSSSSFFAMEVTVTLVYLNSSLNPVLYCWKISGVKEAVKDTIRQVVCCLWN